MVPAMVSVGIRVRCKRSMRASSTELHRAAHLDDERTGHVDLAALQGDRPAAELELAAAALEHTHRADERHHRRLDHVVARELLVVQPTDELGDAAPGLLSEVALGEVNLGADIRLALVAGDLLS